MESKITQMWMCGLKATNGERCRFNEAVKKIKGSPKCYYGSQMVVYAFHRI